MNTNLGLDSRGENCQAYEAEYRADPENFDSCGQYDDADFSADACCVCRPNIPGEDIEVYFEGEWEKLNVAGVKDMDGTLYEDGFGEDNFHEVVFDLNDDTTDIWYNGLKVNIQFIFREHILVRCERN